jgi:hypothetical protein
MSNNALFDINQEEFKPLIEAKKLYMLDGWLEPSPEFDKKMVLVLTDSGIEEVKLRYFTWSDEYNFLHIREKYFTLWLRNEEDYDYLDESNAAMCLVSPVIPNWTQHTIEAEKIMENYWESFYQNNDN